MVFFALGLKKIKSANGVVSKTTNLELAVVIPGARCRDKK